MHEWISRGPDPQVSYPSRDLTCCPPRFLHLRIHGGVPHRADGAGWRPTLWRPDLCSDQPLLNQVPSLLWVKGGMLAGGWDSGASPPSRGEAEPEGKQNQRGRDKPGTELSGIMWGREISPQDLKLMEAREGLEPVMLLNSCRISSSNFPSLYV